MPQPLMGFADLHTHPMAHLGFGGKVMAGKAWNDIDGNDDITRALQRCDQTIHGKWGIGDFGNGWSLTEMFIEHGFGHGVCGHPDFSGWPHFRTVAHQQMFVDWIKRAWAGGLRVLCALAVNNELLAKEFGAKQYDDESAIDVQARELRRFVQAHSSWMELALSPNDLRRIVASGKLAVIAGVEVDSLDSIRSSLAKVRASGFDVNKTGDVLDWLWDRGIRMITPIHLANNSFGGCAIYSDLFNLLNHFLRGEFYGVEGNRTVSYRLAGDETKPFKEAWVAIQYYSLTHPGAYYPTTAYDSFPAGQGHSNVKGLTAEGQSFLTAAMKRGFLIDIDHMSDKATNAALTLAERWSYPVLSSHSAFRDLGLGPNDTPVKSKWSHEGMKTPQQVDRILALGGLVAPITNQCDVKSFNWPENKVLNNCARSSRSWAQSYLYAVERLRRLGKGGVAVGTDFNGLAEQPGPRYGDDAAYGLKGDAKRERFRWTQRKMQVESRKVTYPFVPFSAWHPMGQADAGNRRYDINQHGLAHYGLLPDFIEDLRKVGVKDDQLTHLFDSAEALAKMWETCEANRQGVAGAVA